MTQRSTRESFKSWKRSTSFGSVCYKKVNCILLTHAIETFLESPAAMGCLEDLLLPDLLCVWQLQLQVKHFVCLFGVTLGLSVAPQHYMVFDEVSLHCITNILLCVCSFHIPVCLWWSCSCRRLCCRSPRSGFISLHSWQQCTKVFWWRVTATCISSLLLGSYLKSASCAGVKLGPASPQPWGLSSSRKSLW